jgi:hypothetical protein
MLTIKYNTVEVNKILNNTVEYTKGFFEGIQMERLEFNRILGGFAAEALGKYIDAKARSNPYSLHHVYEWNATGNSGARLFKFNVVATASSIKIVGDFLPSNSTSDTSDVPFVDKARVMEEGIAIEISPVNSNVLAFTVNGEQVFTANSIWIDHPGGDAVAGSFGETVAEFFDVYFTNSMLDPLLKQLSTAREYTDNFPAGTKGGRLVGVRAGRKYMHLSGLEFVA